MYTRVAYFVYMIDAVFSLSINFLTGNIGANIGSVTKTRITFNLLQTHYTVSELMLCNMKVWTIFSAI